MQGHYLLTVNTYFFVSTILKVPAEFSFGIGMVITEKYRPIPTEKYRLDTTLEFSSGGIFWGLRSLFLYAKLLVSIPSYVYFSDGYNQGVGKARRGSIAEIILLRPLKKRDPRIQLS